MSFTNANHLGTSQNDWLKELDFYQEELNILGGRLLEVAGKNNGAEASAGIEHFQNQFIVQQTNIAELRHRIHKNSHHAFEDVKEHAGRVETNLVTDNDAIGEDVKQFEKTFNELRKEFNLFLTKWM
jgi:hypothetical protein